MTLLFGRVNTFGGHQWPTWNLRSPCKLLTPAPLRCTDPLALSQLQPPHLLTRNILMPTTPHLLPRALHLG